MFESLTIIDCSTVLAGPSVGTFFAELGAKVVKIEHPTLPDVTRSWKLASEETNALSAYFSSVNFKKIYAHLDLSIATDRLELLEKLETADIFLSNFKKGDAEKFGITSDILHAINPRLIIGKISGFGDESDRVAYDLILQAETGFMSMNGTPESGPTKMPVALIDVLAAHQLKEGILVALYKRLQTNKGSVVSVSLYDAAIASLANQASNYLMAGHVPQRIGSLHPNIAPYGEIFKTKDEQQITFAIGSNRHFAGLCAFLKLDTLANDEQFSTNSQRVTNRVKLQSLLQERITNLSAAAILNAMQQEAIPAGLVKNLAAVFESETAQALIRSEQINKQETKRVTQIAFKINE
ncbi:MAG: CoA transferase [Fluviicola sp.]|nr:CoA transferase [Fluviicola sp.]MBP6271230.1 CoA transferase [Fluviicola sp.]